MIKRTQKDHYPFEEILMDVKAIFNQNQKAMWSVVLSFKCVCKSIVGKHSMPLKLVFVRNRNKRNKYLVSASMDMFLTEDKIIQLMASTGRSKSISKYASNT